jgi:hypothetical protein
MATHPARKRWYPLVVMTLCGCSRVAPPLSIFSKRRIETLLQTVVRLPKKKSTTGGWFPNCHRHLHQKIQDERYVCHAQAKPGQCELISGDAQESYEAQLNSRTRYDVLLKCAWRSHGAMCAARLSYLADQC